MIPSEKKCQLFEQKTSPQPPHIQSFNPTKSVFRTLPIDFRLNYGDFLYKFLLDCLDSGLLCYRNLGIRGSSKSQR